MRQLELIVFNESVNRGNIILYQQFANLRDPAMRSLAWLVKPAFPKTRVAFRWQESYNFVWSEIGRLESGITFEASQARAAEPGHAGKNSVRLTYKSGAFSFREPRISAPEGNLLIEEDETIPLGRVSVGLGMNGQAVLALPAQPNLNLLIRPEPRYFLTFGWSRAGEVMELVEPVAPIELTFPYDTHSLTVTLTPMNTWTLGQPNAQDDVYGKPAPE